tara:strand:- start:157 stop:372 length:216 start_codon:yes stop_codon:yes gene_type:complete
MKSLEKRVSNLEESIKDIVALLQKMVEEMHTHPKRIKELETKVLIMQSQQHVIDIVSNISRQKPMKDVFDE